MFDTKEADSSTAHRRRRTVFVCYGTILHLKSDVIACVSVFSPHVVRYYGSYFKNSDLWIVMEYCGAGSVSDIIRIRNKTVRRYSESQSHTHRLRRTHCTSLSVV